MGNNRRMTLSALVALMLFLTLFVNLFASPSFFSFIGMSSADDNDSSWDNTTSLNVTIEHPEPRILWYDFQKCTSYSGATPPALGETWESVRNQQIDVDNETWYRFVINISSDQGWDNIEWINISAWHDNGTDSDNNGSLNDPYGGYNRSIPQASNNLGANRNFFLYYENRTGSDTEPGDGNPFFNITYPINNSEITKGDFTEDFSTDPLGVAATQNHNLTFEFKPGYQFRYAAGDGSWDNDTITLDDWSPSGPGYSSTTSCWESFDDIWSWNFNITVENSGENWPNRRYKSWVNDEFGVYSYTEIVSAGWPVIQGRPGATFSTNSSSWFNSNSENISIRTRSNGNYSMKVNITDLRHHYNPAITLSNYTVYVRGGTRTKQINFSGPGDANRQFIFLYGSGAMNDGSVTSWETHEPNGTWKETGEAADDGLDATYHSHYDSNSYGSHNSQSHYVEYACAIPAGTQSGTYRRNLYYQLRTQTN